MVFDINKVCQFKDTSPTEHLNANKFKSSNRAAMYIRPFEAIIILRGSDWSIQIDFNIISSGFVR